MVIKTTLLAAFTLPILAPRVTLYLRYFFGAKKERINFKISRVARAYILYLLKFNSNILLV